MTTGLKSTGIIIQETPQDFFDFLNGIFRFDLDVCALPENAKCERYYTPSDDGLKNPWGGVYGAIRLTERTLSTGSGRPRRNTSNRTAGSSSCCFRRGRTRNGFRNMCIPMPGCGSWTDGSVSAGRRPQHRFLAWWRSTSGEKPLDPSSPVVKEGPEARVSQI